MHIIIIGYIIFIVKPDCLYSQRVGSDMRKKTMLTKVFLLAVSTTLLLALSSMQAIAHQKTVSGGAGITYKFVHVDEAYEFPTKREESSQLDEGRETIMQKGQNGIKDVEYKITYINGKETTRDKVSEKIKKQPVEEVIAVGVKQGEQAPPEESPMKAFGLFGVLVVLGTAGIAFIVYQTSKPKSNK